MTASRHGIDAFRERALKETDNYLAPRQVLGEALAVTDDCSIARTAMQTRQGYAHVVGYLHSSPYFQRLTATLSEWNLSSQTRAPNPLTPPPKPRICCFDALPFALARSSHKRSDATLPSTAGTISRLSRKCMTLPSEVVNENSRLAGVAKKERGVGSVSEYAAIASCPATELEN